MQACPFGPSACRHSLNVLMPPLPQGSSGAHASMMRSTPICPGESILIFLLSSWPCMLEGSMTCVAPASLASARRCSIGSIATMTGSLLRRAATMLPIPTVPAPNTARLGGVAWTLTCAAGSWMPIAGAARWAQLAAYIGKRWFIKVPKPVWKPPAWGGFCVSLLTSNFRFNVQQSTHMQMCTQFRRGHPCRL